MLCAVDGCGAAIGFGPVLGTGGVPTWVLLLVTLCAFGVVVWSALSVLREVRQRVAGGRPEPPAEPTLFERHFRPTPLGALTPGDLRIQRFYSYYHPRPEVDDNLVELLSARRGVLLTGPSGAGKSRSLLEALKRCRELGSFTVLLPVGPIYPALLDGMPVPKGDYLLLLDDVDRFCDPHRSVRGMLEILEGAEGEVVVVGLLSRGERRARYELFGDLFGPLAEVRVGPLPREQLATLAERTSCQDILKEADRNTPLDTLIPIRRLRAGYENLSEPEKVLLRCLKAMRALNLDPTEDVVAEIYAAHRPDGDFERAVAGIRSNGFVGYDKGRFVAADRVLDQVGSCAAETATALRVLQEKARLPELWRAGLQLDGLEDYARSRECFEAIRRAAPGEADPLLVACLAAHETEEADVADAATETAEPAHEPDTKREALELAILGETEEAIRKLRQVIAIHADDADCHFWLAEMHQRMGELEAAERHFKQGLRADALDARAHFEYGKFLERRNQGRAALSEYFTSALLKILGGRADLKILDRCEALADALDDEYTRYLIAGFYAGILCTQGESERAVAFARELEPERGKVPIVDGILGTVLGIPDATAIEGDDLEARAARTLVEQIRAAAASRVASR